MYKKFNASIESMGKQYGNLKKNQPFNKIRPHSFEKFKSSIKSIDIILKNSTLRSKSTEKNNGYDQFKGHSY
jgi:hypothetical protein